MWHHESWKAEWRGPQSQPAQAPQGTGMALAVYAAYGTLSVAHPRLESDGFTKERD